MSETVSYKPILSVEVLSDVQESDTVLVERNGSFKRTPASLIGNTPEREAALQEAIEKAESALEQIPVLNDNIAKHYVQEDIDIDDTLTVTGKVADAGATGKRLNSIVQQLPVVSANAQSHYVLETSDIDATLTAEGKVADAKAVGQKIGELKQELIADPKSLGWSDLSAYSSEDRAILLEAGKPVFTDSVQAVFDGLNDSSATLTIEGVAYTVRGLGEIKDSLMYKEGKLQICHKIIADGSSLNTSSEFEDVICTDLSAVIKQVILPCSPTELLGKKLARISYADCGAYLDGIHDDYEAMYRAHYIGNMTNCTVEQHGGQIYKANSGWLIIEDHNVDLSGSVLIIDEYNRYGYYWLSAYSIWDMSDDQTTAFREQMKEYSTYWPAAEINFRTNGLFLVTYPGAATRYNSGEVTVEDRVEVVRHGADGKVYNSVIDDAPDNAEIRFSVYPETQLTFIGCTLKIDIYFSTVAMYFMRCCRSNCVIRDFVIDPSRRTTNNTGYRGHVFDIQECADVTLENIKGINIAGKPNEEYPRGTAGYILHAYCALNLMVRDCYMLGYWGCTGLNGVKDVTFDNCDLNRVDTHDYFRNLTINNCRLYGQVIQVGYGKGAVNISNCSIMTDWVNYVLNLRCDYGRYFEGEINISNINVVFTGSGSYDIVGGTSMFSQTSAEKTGLYIKRYPTVKVTNATIRVLNGSSAGYVFNMPTDIESLVQVDDKRKVVGCLNLTVYNDAGDPLTMPLCPLDGVVENDMLTMQNLAAEVNDLSARLAALEQSGVGGGTTAVDYLYYSRRSITFAGTNASARLRLPYEETAVIYHVQYKLVSGTDVTMTITDWTLEYTASADEDVYIRLPAGAMSNSKEMIFAVYPGTSNSGVYEITVERTADTDAYTGTIQLDFAS